MHPKKLTTNNKSHPEYFLLNGQNRYMYGVDTSVDFQDMVDWGSEERVEGRQMYFYDLKTNKKYSPFLPQINVLYAKPLWHANSIYILQGDFNQKQVRVYKYLPENQPQLVYEQRISKLSMYNLELTPGDKVYLTTTNLENKTISQQSGWLQQFPDGLWYIV